MEYKSIADALAAAERKQSEKSAAASATRKSQGARFAPARSSGSAATGSRSPADGVDLRDDFDFAIEAVDGARRSVSHNAAAVEAAAVGLLMGRRQITRGKAVTLVKRAIEYLEN